jgi:hypothetical protein
LAKFSVPLTFLTKNGPVVLDDEDRLSANMDALTRRYEQIGAIEWKYSIRKAQVISRGIHLIDLEWRFFNSDNELLYACDTSYFVAGETNMEAKVMAIIAHNENDEYQKALDRKSGA